MKSNTTIESNRYRFIYNSYNNNIIYTTTNNIKIKTIKERGVIEKTRWYKNEYKQLLIANGDIRRCDLQTKKKKNILSKHTCNNY